MLRSATWPVSPNRYASRRSSHRLHNVVEVRTKSAQVHHHGVQLVARETTVVFATRWGQVGAGYRRPIRVIDDTGAATAIRDHSMMVRAGGLLCVLLMPKGMRR